MQRFTRREFVRRSGLAVATVAVAPTALAAACATDDDGNGDGEAAGLLARAEEQGFLQIGFANESPYGFEDDQGNITGEAPELAREILGQLGIPEIRGEVVEFGSLIPGINAGRFDLIAAGMFITPERCGQILFTDPDYCAPQALAVKAGNPLDLTDYESVAANDDATLGVLRGAVEVGYAEDLGVPDDRVEVLPDPPSMLSALQADRIDAFALTSITVRELVGAAGEDVEMTETFVPVIDGEEELGCGGFGFRNEDRDARDEFNRVLNEMKQNDEILPIIEEFGFSADETDLAKDMTADELCAA